MSTEDAIEVEASCGRERSGEPAAEIPSIVCEGSQECRESMSTEDAIEVEASCGRERSGSPQPKSGALFARDLKNARSR